MVYRVTLLIQDPQHIFSDDFDWVSVKDYARAAPGIVAWVEIIGLEKEGAHKYIEIYDLARCND